MRASFIWQPWARLRWPATAAHELAFVDALTTLAGAPDDTNVRRDDVTLLLDALRCGLDLDELTVAAPGCDPRRLLTAYHLLERERVEAAAAWTAIVQNPTVAMFEEMSPAASRLLPVPVSRVSLGLVDDDERELAELIELEQTLVRAVAVRSLEVEREIDGASSETDTAQLGLLLYDPVNGSLWDHSHFLPPRVGALSPTRTADLLGERYTDAPRPDDMGAYHLPPNRRAGQH